MDYRHIHSSLDTMLLNLLTEPELVALTMEKVLRCNMRGRACQEFGQYSPG
jgi:hypothetical protein